MKVIKKPIEMIDWFDKESNPHPVRFRIMNEDNSNKVIKVDWVITRDTENLQRIPYEFIKSILQNFDQLLKSCVTREQQKVLIHMIIS